MDIEKRLSNLENLVNALSKKIDSIKYYTDADINGTRQSVSEITPYTETKTAYIGDTEIVFDDCPSGNLTVYLTIPYTVERMDNRVTVYFDTLEEPTNITISIV